MQEKTPNASQKLPRRSWTRFEKLHFWPVFDQFSTSWQKSCTAIFSGQRNRFREFPRPNWSYRPKDGSGTPLAKSCVKEASYNHLKGAKTIHNQLPWKSSFSLHPYYSSSRKGFPTHLKSLYESFARAPVLLLQLKALRVISQCSGFTLRAVRLYESLPVGNAVVHDSVFQIHD